MKDEGKMNKTKKVIILLLVVISIILIDRCFINGLIGTIEGIITSEDTVYAGRFNEKLFKKIKIGDSKERVISLIGNPLRKYFVNNVEHWWYSVSPSSGSFFKRAVEFSGDGKVTEIQHYFYLD
jgi:hypothetical protein